MQTLLDGSCEHYSIINTYPGLKLREAAEPGCNLHPGPGPWLDPAGDVDLSLIHSHLLHHRLPTGLLSRTRADTANLHGASTWAPKRSCSCLTLCASCIHAQPWWAAGEHQEPPAPPPLTGLSPCLHWMHRAKSSTFAWHSCLQPPINTSHPSSQDPVTSSSCPKLQ